ncbi:type I-G CRISPR-associated RAMP protein Csb1/Cas7g [Actinomadura sp. 3N407]|uniref:type I-G CRISPR-associated RAMP protein Csb1/Cas7g n=1 Tax=Actinomadura sp. 3N407 TaxID=3457423 RepID=UPI003FCDEF5A
MSVDRIADRLVRATGERRTDAGISFSARYRPAAGGKVMPPSYPEGSYLFEKRWLDGQVSEVVVLDQVPSQANRVEEALLGARDAGRIELPLFELKTSTSRGPVRLTSLQFPHRAADAYLRDSLIDGEPYGRSVIGRRMREVTATDATPLFERDPGSLLFGVWDSRGEGRRARFARVYTSSIVGVDPQEGARKTTRMDPLNLQGGIDDKAKASNSWQYVATGEKVKGQKLSEIGHGNIAPSDAHGGVSIAGAMRNGWISLAGLERLRFGAASAEAAGLARATLAALALAGDRLAFGRPSVWLRSDCDLVRENEVLGFETDGGQVEEFVLTADEAIELFHELRDRTASAGIVMASETVALTPSKALSEAIEYSAAKAPAEE